MYRCRFYFCDHPFFVLSEPTIMSYQPNCFYRSWTLQYFGRQHFCYILSRTLTQHDWPHAFLLLMCGFSLRSVTYLHSHCYHRDSSPKRAHSEFRFLRRQQAGKQSTDNWVGGWIAWRLENNLNSTALTSPWVHH